jgi:hypothetical protein
MNCVAAAAAAATDQMMAVQLATNPRAWTEKEEEEGPARMATAKPAEAAK